MSRLKSTLANALLVIVSIVLTFLSLEVFLWAWAATHTAQPKPVAAVPAPSTEFDAEILIPPEILAAAKARLQVLSMPEAWKRRPTQVPGAAHAEYWQGVLHVLNAEGRRWAKPYPEKQNDSYRVLVVGDSLTYGFGIPEEWRFTDLLNKWMGEKFKIEFLNLGNCGYQSEDILNLIKTHLPKLKPNLVLYAICLNDFLPSGVGEYNVPSAYPFPLPDSVKNFLIRHTRSGAFLNETYDAALRRLHLRTDFFDDILKDFKGYQQRFGRDVAEMNRIVLTAGLPPLVGLVVDQYPAYGSRGYQIAMIAESALAKAGAVVIPTEDFYRRYNGQAMFVSRWEGHPNEVANIIWANMIARALRDRPNIQAYER